MPKILAAQEQVVKDDRTGAFRPKFDLSAVTAYGELTFAAGAGAIALMPDAMMERLCAAIEEFDPGKDYVLPIGDPTVIFFLGLVMGARHGKASVLRWDGKYQRYTVITGEANDDQFRG